MKEIFRKRLRIKPNENCFTYSHAIKRRNKEKKSIASDLFIHSLSISFLSNVKKMLFIILPVINLFEEKENNLSPPSVAQHLGTGNTCLIKVRKRTGKNKLIFVYQTFFQHLQSGCYCKLSSLRLGSNTTLKTFKAITSLQSFV